LRQQIGLFDLQLGDSLINSGQPQAALALLKSARLSSQHLVDQDPTSGMNRLMLVMLDGKIGEALTKAGHPGQALESYRSAVEAGGKLARGDPGSALLQETFADLLRDFGAALMADSKADEAFGIFQTELATRRQLLAIDPANIGWQAEVLNANNRIAEALDKQGKTAEAIETSRATIVEGEHLANSALDTPSVALALSFSSARLCAAASRQNDNISAASHCARSMELQRKLVRLDPNNAGYKKILLGYEKLMPTVQLRAANDAGRYAEALALQAQIAARVEDEETRSTGKPGKETAAELTGLAWQALLAGDPDKAIAACERSLVLQPGDLAAEINRAHALMYLGRDAEARTAYEAHKADLFPDGKSWPQVAVEDFAELRKAGREHPRMAEIEAALGMAGKP
jgi:tetratricopeptide (TPR) repeat protein